MCVCIAYMSARMYVAMYTWWSEDSLMELVLLFYYLGPVDQTHTGHKLGSKHLYKLTHSFGFYVSTRTVSLGSCHFLGCFHLESQLEMIIP